MTTSLQIRGLGRREMAALAENAKRVGMTPDRYVKELVEEHLSLQAQAESTTFADLMAPVRLQLRNSGMTESELDALVDAARTRHRRRVGKRRKK